MPRRPTGWIVVAFAVGGLLLPETISWAQPEPGPGAPPIHTNRTRFRIPYRYDPAELQRLGAREIRLFVSTDGGRNWRHEATVAPDARRFEYEAKADGEFWFAVRTVDSGGQLHPPGAIAAPALKVVVDTRPPALSVTLDETTPGRVQLSWQADDPHVDPSTLRLEYVQPGETRWQAVGVVPKPAGRTAWSVPQPGTVAVRAIVADLAGNVGRSQAQRQVTAAAASDPAAIPDLRQPIADGPMVDVPPRTAETPGPFTASRMTALPADGRFVADDPTLRPNVVAPRYDAELGLDEEPVAVRPETAGAAFDAAAYGTEQPTNSWSPGPASRARIVNSRSFEIDYEVQEVGPSGLSAVEFYVTTDDGAKWWRYGDDEDRTSPFAVTVPQEGTYGFALRARSGAGLAADPPQPGEKPSIVIAVDRTAPRVALMPVQQGTGTAINQVLVRWTVEDANPAEKPIALSYAEDPGGPWEPITGWTADEGRYVWTVGPGAPSRFHVRLTARDAAGNVTRVETDQPVLVDLKKPSARIVDVQSVEGIDGPTR